MIMALRAMMAWLLPLITGAGPYFSRSHLPGNHSSSLSIFSNSCDNADGEGCSFFFSSLIFQTFATSVVFEANALFAAGHNAFVFPCAFSPPPQVRRSVRSTSASSRRDAERARLKVQVPNIALIAFLNLKSLA